MSSLQDFEEPEITNEVEKMRHSCAHVMAHAVQKLWPDAQFGIGPTIENGFYYDLQMSHQLTPQDLPKIEKEMKSIVKKKAPFERQEHPIDKAIQMFREMKQPFKVEIIENLRDQAGAKSVSTYREGDFLDLCRGPHVENTGQIGFAFKLLSVAGAYWRGSEKNPMLQRIYGVAFKDKEELKEHLFLLEEAKKRDHRKLGKELNLFTFQPEAPSSPFFLPKGAQIYNRLVDLMREQYRRYGYQEVITPQILDVSLWHRSGHYDNYRENMFFSDIDERQFAVKPMNCPTHTLIFANDKRSYRELPLRIADFGRLHRYERSGVTAGLTRVRTFCQDDAHIFCMPDQIEAEISSVTDMILRTYSIFNMDVKMTLGTRPEKRVGEDSLWDNAEAALKRSLEKMGKPFATNPGDGAFYGPKIDFQVKDALKREHQLATIQLDFNLPERFDLKYVGKDNSLHRPVMIHRAVLGSLERFIGVLVEHVAGAFPFWLAPTQARLIPINDAQALYCHEVKKKLSNLGYRVEVDDRNESMGLKTREAQKAKIPYSMVAGDRELADKTFSLRKYGEQESKVMSVDAIEKLFADLNAIPRKAFE